MFYVDTYFCLLKLLTSLVILCAHLSLVSDDYNLTPIYTHRFQSEGPPLSWNKSKHGDTVNLKCILSSSDPYYIRVNRTEECYKIKRQLPQDDFAHHVFHLHPPLVVHNLLPFDLYLVSCITLWCMSRL